MRGTWFKVAIAVIQSNTGAANADALCIRVDAVVMRRTIHLLLVNLIAGTDALLMNRDFPRLATSLGRTKGRRARAHISSLAGEELRISPIRPNEKC